MQDNRNDRRAYWIMYRDTSKSELRYWKEKSVMMLFSGHINLKYKFENRTFPVTTI